MFVWDEENIQWMEEAAAETNYYEKLGQYVAPYLKENDRVCEIGCGLGHLACDIASRVEQVTAIDVSGKAITKVQDKIRERKIINLSTWEGDWCGFNPPGPYDVVMLSYFSALRKNWPELMKLSGRIVIAILANGKSGTLLESNLYQPIYEENSSRETIFNVVPFLEEKKISYELIECEMEYGQPLRDYEDAYQYLSRYYKGNEAEKNQYLQKNLVFREKGCYLPKLKKSGILIVKIPKGDETMEDMI